MTIAIEPERLESPFGIRLSDYITMADSSASVAISHHAIHQNSDLRRTTAEIFANNLSGRLRSAYLAAKAQELLALTLHSLSEATQELRQQLTERDVLAIQHARSIIESSITDVPDVALLSRTVGVNRTKLFYGFKRLYGMSVTHYAKDFKMNRARRMLAGTNLRVSEITQALGYEHSANFSTQFKSRFNCSPRNFRAQVKAM
ncbi:AraC family transcriptional regulator [Sphingomonas sp. LR60]|uniref:helix-turn-helix domain-containing protein n=1 Tax=Sphingomonas sp. LR60 TaxID=3050233 RepID=UPI002FE29A46